MSLRKAFNLHQWIEENRHLLKPPVGNQQIYKGNDDFIVMVVGGPNSRKDYHFNEGEEFFYQLEGDILVKIVEDGKHVDIPIKAGEIFLLPPRTPHSPRRPAGSVGIVVERYRTSEEKDGFLWYCENCGKLLHEEYFALTDIEKQFPVVMERFYSSEILRTCKNCGTVMSRPK